MDVEKLGGFMFKKATIFYVENIKDLVKSDLENKIHQLCFDESIIDSFTFTSGFYPLENGGYILQQDNCIMFCVAKSEKKVSEAIIKQYVDRKIKSLGTSSVDYDTIRNEVSDELYARAFAKVTFIHGYFDLKESFLFIDSTNEKDCRLFQMQLLKCVDTLNFTKIQLKQSDFENLVHSNTVPDLVVQENIKLELDNGKDEPKSLVSAVNFDIFAVNNFKAFDIKKASFTYNNGICGFGFALTNKSIFSQMKFDDDSNNESSEEEFVNRFFIMTQTLRRFMSALITGVNTVPVSTPTKVIKNVVNKTLH